MCTWNFFIIRRGLEFSQWSMSEGKCDGLSWQLWRWKWARQVRMLLSTGVELNLTQVQDRWAKATVITATHSKAFSSMRAHWAEKISCQRKMFSIFPTVQFSNLADFYIYLTLISLSKINLYHRFKLWSRSARFSDDLQIWNGQIVQNGVLFHPSSCEDCFPSWNSQFRL